MTLGWLLVGFFRDLFFQARNERDLVAKQTRNRDRVLARIKTFPFYSKLNISGWSDIPVISKREFLREFKNLNTGGLELGDVAAFAQKMELTHDPQKKYQQYTVGLSTGTSGTRGAFVLGNREIGLWAGSILARALGWKIFRRQKVAFVFRTNGPLYEGINRGWIQMRFFDINQDVQKISKELKNWQPTVLISVPHFFSRYLNAKKVAEIHPHTVFSCADVLDQTERKKIENYFKIPVREIYQATEGFLGISCVQGELHLNEDDYIFEKSNIDENRFYPIITDVERRTQAIIRYELDDILVQKNESCRCGRPGIILERIEGRADQVLIFSNTLADKQIEIYPDQIRRLLRDGGWYDWNYLVKQTGPHSITIVLDKVLIQDKVYELIRLFRNAFEGRGMGNVDIAIDYATEFPELRGKRRRIIGLSL